MLAAKLTSSLRRIRTTILLAGVIAACDKATDPIFGAQYRVVLAPGSPVLSSTSLSIAVAYGRCSGNREFTLKNHRRAENRV